jgi:hypothetical protein
MQETDDRKPEKPVSRKNVPLGKEEIPEKELLVRNRYINKGRETITNRKGRQSEALSAIHTRVFATERIDPAFTLLM